MAKQKHSKPLLWARAQQVSGTQKLVLLCLAMRCNQDWNCWPSLASLERDTGLGNRTIRKALFEMEKAGLVASKQRYKRSNVFVLSPALDAAQKELQLLSALGAGQNSVYQRGYNKGWTDGTAFKKEMGLGEPES